MKKQKALVLVFLLILIVAVVFIFLQEEVKKDSSLNNEGTFTTTMMKKDLSEEEGVSLDPCHALVGREFISIEDYPVGMGPDGPVLGKWGITFISDFEYSWSYSDVGTGGNYICEDGFIEVQEIESVARFDLNTRMLTWDGVEYFLVE